MTATKQSLAFTDFEEGIVFDEDDPDFHDSVSSRYRLSCPSLHKPSSEPKFNININRHLLSFSGHASPIMSLASVHPNTGLSHRSQSFGSVSSLDDLHGSYYSTASEAVISIEELKLQLNSCFTCGVSWCDDHVSLDCAECGGYSLERPCPLCDGRCSSVWKRDLTMSHACGKARWEGECQLLLKPITADDESRLCKRLEKLAASS